MNAINRLLPLLAGFALLVVVVVAMRGCDGGGSGGAAMTAVPKAPSPDADTPADTIRTLTAEVAALKSETEKLRAENERLTQIRDQVASRVSREVTRDLERRQKLEASERDAQMAALKQRLEALSQQVLEANAKQFGGGQEVPAGFGLEGGTVRTTQLTWIDPLDIPPEALEKGPLSQAAGKVKGLLGGGAHAARERIEAAAESLDTAVTGQVAEPVYTVPRNATLIGSVAMTALIGRVPHKGQVEDPFPFKVLVGAENLAANGLEIPHVAGMVFSGKAVGDWTLSCVRGVVHSVTYLFDDGTIRTLSSDDGSLQQTGGNQRNRRRSQNNRPLGWISDAYGVPCITGKRISNAASYLAGRVTAKGVEAAAKALSQSRTTQQISPLTGVVTTTVDPNKALQMAGYETLAGGAGEVAKWLQERAADLYDAVFVPSGHEVAVHVDVELPIDFEPEGRRLDHDWQMADTTVSVGGLD